MGHVRQVASMAPNKRLAAKRLGVSERQFYQVVKDQKLGYMFKRHRPQARCITKEQIIEIAHEGYTRRDTAFLLGISDTYLKDLIRIFGIADEFTVRKGKAAWVTVKGYCQ